MTFLRALRAPSILVAGFLSLVGCAAGTMWAMLITVQRLQHNRVPWILRLGHWALDLAPVRAVVIVA